ncbi:MAG TPA: hypothetical protein PKH07_15080, partial [bacterium]|nr:hypothetical protein [bacterium]
MTESLFGPQQIVEMLHEIASQIQRRNPGRELAFVGIRARGVPLAHRLQTILEQEYSRRTFFGILDITLYRDDSVLFGGIAVGGIRISHLSDIEKDLTMQMTVSRTS